MELDGILATLKSPIRMRPISKLELLNKVRLLVCKKYMPTAAGLTNHNSSPTYVENMQAMFHKTGFYRLLPGADVYLSLCLKSNLVIEDVAVIINLNNPELDTSVIVGYKDSPSAMVLWDDHTSLTLDLIELNKQFELV